VNAATQDRIETLIGGAVESARAAAGGSIARSHAVRLRDGRHLFVKDYGDAPPRIAACEARGLAWLAEADAIDVALVVAVDPDAPLLVLEWIEPGRPAPDFAERLGHGLAALHAAGAPGFGFEEPNFIGPLPQPNDAAPDWPTFYAEARLRPMLRQARDAGALDAATVRAAEAVIARLPERCGPPEPPARLHGDLWRGNLLVDAAGAPVVVDPAVHGGHREIDLAMMRLFGGFPARAFDAYEEAAPLAPGARERVPLYQLYPLLVHVVLFGGGYADQLADALHRCR